MADPKVKTEVKKEKTRPVRVSKYQGKTVRKLNVPMMKLNAGDCVAVQFTGEITQKKIGKGDKPPATVYRAVDLDTGEMVDIIMPTVALSTVEQFFPDGVKGKKLLLEVSQRADKNYKDVIISEL